MKLKNVCDIAASLKGTLDEISQDDGSEFNTYLRAELAASLHKAEKLLESDNESSSEELGNCFFQLGLYAGLVQGELDSAFRYGRQRKANSAGGASGAIHLRNEKVLLSCICLRYLNAIKTHDEAISWYQSETGMEMNYDSFRRLLKKFRKGEKLWVNSSVSASPKELEDAVRKSGFLTRGD